MKKFDYIVYIGRFQPFHNAHFKTVQHALELADKVIILLGSSNQPRTIKNPFTWDERAKMIKECFASTFSGQNSEPDSTRIICRPIEDAPYNNQVWARWVQSEVDQLISIDDWGSSSTKKIGIIGYEKDGSSFYLKMFPQWEFVPVENYEGMNATDIRENLFTEIMFTDNGLPKPVFEWIKKFMLTQYEEFNLLLKEYNYIAKYKLAWINAPYPPTFVTVDAVVVQSGHVLMVRRGAHPGMNQLALPGGFLNQDESTEDAMLRELREETKLKVPEPVIRGSIKASKLFDNPNRSLRGRTLTNAFLIELAPGDLPKVKGGDDAKKAMWIPLVELNKMKDQCFEDHHSIINTMLGYL